MWAKCKCNAFLSIHYHRRCIVSCTQLETVFGVHIRWNGICVGWPIVRMSWSHIHQANPFAIAISPFFSFSMPKCGEKKLHASSESEKWRPRENQQKNHPWRIWLFSICKSVFRTLLLSTVVFKQTKCCPQSLATLSDTPEHNFKIFVFFVFFCRLINEIKAICAQSIRKCGQFVQTEWTYVPYFEIIFYNKI